MNKMLSCMRSDDEYETPLSAVKIIEPYLKRQSIIWCPFDEEHSNFVNYFYDMGHEVIYGHINTGQDFLLVKFQTMQIILSQIRHIAKKMPYMNVFIR